MLILTIRTDKPEAEIGLFNNSEKLAYVSWQAHRELAENLHLKIQQLLDGCKKSWDGLEGIVCYKGPGSFTGLRIGLSVANTLAFGLEIPVVGGRGSQWEKKGIAKLVGGAMKK